MNRLKGICSLLNLLDLLNRLGGYLALLILQDRLGGWLEHGLCGHHGLRLHRDARRLLGNGHLLNKL